MNYRNCVLQNFPFVEDDFDSLTDYQLFCEIYGYVKNLDKFYKNEFINKIEEYIQKEFNNIMMKAMYESSTETIRFYWEENTNE